MARTDRLRDARALVALADLVEAAYPESVSVERAHKEMRRLMNGL